MATRQLFVIIFVSSILGCSQTKQKTNDIKTVIDSIQEQTPVNSSIKLDTANQDIYDFVKVVIADQKLDLLYALTNEPEQSCDLSQDDNAFLKTLLIEQQKQKENADTGDWRTKTITVNLFELPKCLTEDDIAYMLSQKLKLSTFKWDNSRLNFNPNNNKNWYCFLLPLFSKDRRKAVMMIRNLCPGLCGTGRTVLFTKQHSKWISQTVGQWIH
jgi:hypothetical protein